MYYVYVLINTVNKELYIGYTNNLEKRIGEHNTGKNKSTNRKGQWILTYAEMYKSKKDAQMREHRLKYYGQALARLKERISDSLSIVSLVWGR